MMNPSELVAGIVHAHKKDVLDLADRLIGELGPARRHIQRLLDGEIDPCIGVYREIQKSIERCVQRVDQELK